MAQTNYRDPTPAEYAVVKRVWEQSGILTIKDKVTADWQKPQERCGGVAWEKPWQNRPAYGEDYRPNVVGQAASEVGFATLTKHRRAIRVDHVGTKMIPEGVAVGGVEVWVCADVFGQGDMKCVRWLPDISFGEEDALHRWSRGIHNVSDAEYADAEHQARFRQANRTATQVDPAGALVKALAPALQQIMSAKPASGPSAEELAAAGFYQDADGTWKRRELAATGAPKK